MKRIICFAFFAGLAIFLGLGSRVYAGAGQAFIHLYVGDVLYAILVYILLRWLGFSSNKTIILTVLFCFSIEFLQLVQMPFLEKIRATLFGKLVLGSGFLWSDLLCYLLGACIGWVCEKTLSRNFSQ